MKVINFFGAPGAGKTTSSFKLLSLMKEMQLAAEPSLEFVKEYIHANNNNLLAYQNYIFAQQERQLRILLDNGEINYAISDAPLLHSSFYAPEKYPVFFKELVFEIFNEYDNINFFIERNHQYSNQGRIHNEEQSDFINKKMKLYLLNHSIPFTIIKSTDNIKEKVLAEILAK